VSVPTNVRFPEAVDHSLREYVAVSGEAKSAVITQALSEWLRLQGHPLIRFVRAANGERRAALSGGPEVWSVVESWLAHDPQERSIAVVADATGLDAKLVEAALAYWADNRAEIEFLLDSLHAAQEQEYAAWARRQAVLGL